jgi:hypothetical protein
MLATVGTVAGSPPTYYKLESGRFAEYRREMVIRLSIVVPPLLAGSLYLAWHFDRERGLFGLISIAALICWDLYRQFKDQRNKWESLVFEFRAGKLMRRMDKYPVLELVPNEVTAIRESPRGLTIDANNRPKRLFVSKRLSNYEMFRGQVVAWASTAQVIGPHPSSWDYVRNVSEVLACAWIFGGPLYLMYTSHQAVILPLGIVLLFSTLAMILYFRNSPNLPISAQKSIWLLLLLPIFAMLVHLR